MKKILLLFVLFLVGCVSETIKYENSGVEIMQLTSPDFQNEQVIPKAFTCEGEDKSPALQWSDVPEGTKSFALSVIDPDAPSGDFIHWLAYDIPADTREIPQNGKVGVALENDFPKIGWGGPCPPPGHGIHRYFFTLYALDVEKLEVTKDNFLQQVKEHSIGQAVLMGTYERRK